MLSNDGEIREPISFRNKSKVFLLNNYKELLNYQQVSQSLSKVPIEYVELRSLKLESDTPMPITETYFSMPLFHLFNQEMINFNSPELPVDDLEFLC